MSSKESLIIHNLNFEIEINSKEHFKIYADRLSRLSKTTLLSRLQGVLDKYELPAGKLIIKKLEIDLGEISAARFENTILEGILYEIEKFISKNVQIIKQEITQDKFKSSSGEKHTIYKSDYLFESDHNIAKSIFLNEEIKQRKIEPIDLNNLIIKEGLILDKKVDTSNIIKIQNQDPSPKEKKPKRKSDSQVVNLFDLINETDQADLTIRGISEKEIDGPKKFSEKQIPEKEEIQLHEENIIREKFEEEPRKITLLEEVFIYYLKYGRLPSNVKYELGTSMTDVISKDEQFLKEVSKQIEHDDQAKDRLTKLLDQGKKEPEFNPRIPNAFEDYFTALIHGLPISMFTSNIRRYDLNDMIRFIYADNPQKLRNLIKYLLIEYPSDKDWNDLVDNLFNRISKPSVVKLISSFASKGAYLNKNLNALNRESGSDLKNAQKQLFKLFLSGADFDIYHFEVKPRVYFNPGPEYGERKLNSTEILNYYFKHGTFPYTYGHRINIQNIESLILSLKGDQLSKLSFFQGKKSINYETFGNLSEKAMLHLVKSLVPNQENDIKNKYLYFKHNIESGIPETFQKSFMLYYGLKDYRKSYLEEMINYWKEQFGDADSVIKQRWKVKNDLESELNMLISITSKKVEDELKVEYAFDRYPKDISVKNAGLVILWPFLKVYFKMLDLLNDEGNFRSMEERARACHLLQYLAIKRSYGEEFYYPLNKILTGYPLEEPLPYEITMTKKEEDISNALLKNVIRQWNALKGGSIDGLRGSFLIRDGILAPSTNGWLLTVQNKAYDILMDKLPWGIGMIKLSWAPYVLNVEWERKFT